MQFSALFNDDALALAAPSRSNSDGMALVVDHAINEIAAAAPSRGTTGEIFRSLAADPDGRAEFAGALAAEMIHKLSPENSSQEAAAAEASAAPDPSTRNDGKRRGARRSGRGAAA